MRTRVVIALGVACAAMVACSHHDPGGNWMRISRNMSGAIYVDTLRMHVMDPDHATAVIRYEPTTATTLAGIEHHAAVIESVEHVDCSAGTWQIEQITAYDSAGSQLTQLQGGPSAPRDLGDVRAALCAFVARKAP